MSDAKPYLVHAAAIKAEERTFSHPWNAKSELTGTHLSRLTGLQRSGVSIVRIAPGKESFAYHSHTTEEEWLYIMSGSGQAEIDGKTYAVGPGDFMGFPTPGVAHHLVNTGNEMLVYLMGGENKAVEIAEFPKLGKLMVRRKGQVLVFDLADGKPLGPLK
jgi:uncharacterized cupin superfamily protein